MNILTEDQATSRNLALPGDALLATVDPEFIAELQLNGTFVEYNQQVIVGAGEPLDYVICIVCGEAIISRYDENYAKSRVGTLGSGQWFGELGLFLRAPTTDELSARGEVVVWRIASDTLRDLFFRRPAAVQLLYNFAVLLAQKLVLTNTGSVVLSTATQ